MSNKVIHIKKVLGNTLNTRDEASKLMQYIRSEKVEVSVVLDFREVIFMSRSFADQFYKEQQAYIQTASARIQIADADIQIIDMLEAVSRTQRRGRSFIEYPVYTFDAANSLMDYLQAI